MTVSPMRYRAVNQRVPGMRALPQMGAARLFSIKEGDHDVRGDGKQTVWLSDEKYLNCHGRTRADDLQLADPDSNGIEGEHSAFPD